MFEYTEFVPDTDIILAELKGTNVMLSIVRELAPAIAGTVPKIIPGPISFGYMLRPFISREATTEPSRVEYWVRRNTLGSG